MDGRIEGNISLEKVLAFVSGLVLVATLLVIAVLKPDMADDFLIAVVLSLSAGLFAAMIPGAISTEGDIWDNLRVKAAGGFAVFLIVLLVWYLTYGR